MAAPEHPFAQYLRILGKGKTASRALREHEAYAAMRMILCGDVQEVQLGAFLLLLRVKEESVDELLGFVRAVREHSESTPDTPAAATQDNAIDLDWPSYAGKSRHLPWYLLAAFALANSGYRIVMHGAAGHTAARVYTEDVLHSFGMPIANDLQSAQQATQHGGFAYLPLRNFCAPLADIIDLRPLLGLRSPVHTLCRLLNPLAAPCSLQSVFHPSYALRHHGAALALGQPFAMVMKGDGGEFELRPQADSTIHTIRDGKACEESWPRGLTDKTTATTMNPELMLQAWHIGWDGESSGAEHATGPVKAALRYGELATLGTMAVAISLLENSSSQARCYVRARECWAARRRDFLAAK